MGVDFAGLLMVKGKTNGVMGSNEVKIYICLFTCLSTRAFHLMESLDIEIFIKALRRFSARQGLPATMWSNNTKTFKSMAKELKQLIHCPKLFEHMANKGVKWCFIVDRSPWQGGASERLVHLLNWCLVKMIGRAMLSYFKLSTILIETEIVIIARPLTYIYNDTEGISYTVTPSHLINGRNLLQEQNNSYSEIVSAYESLSRRGKYQNKLLFNLHKDGKTNIC